MLALMQLVRLTQTAVLPKFVTKVFVRSLCLPPQIKLVALVTVVISAEPTVIAWAETAAWDTASKHVAQVTTAPMVSLAKKWQQA